jgi:hypothetical protein
MPEFHVVTVDERLGDLGRLLVILRRDNLERREMPVRADEISSVVHEKPIRAERERNCSQT